MKTDDIVIKIQDDGQREKVTVTKLIGDITLESWISGQAGKMTFTFTQSPTAPTSFYEGALVELWYPRDKCIFKGYVFTKSRGSDGVIHVVAYDQLRYFKNKDTYTFKGMSSSEIFDKLCADLCVKHKVIDHSEKKLGDMTYDNKPLAYMMQEVLDKTLVEYIADTKGETGKEPPRFMVRDNAGELQHLDATKLPLFVIGDSMDETDEDKPKPDRLALSDYYYKSTIDEDTYNQIKLVSSDPYTKERLMHVESDMKNKNRWGALQYFENLPSGIHKGKLEEIAQNLLKLHNRIQRTISFECMGDFSIWAGSMIKLDIKTLLDITLEHKCIVTRCCHSINNDLHIMSLEVEIIWPERN